MNFLAAAYQILKEAGKRTQKRLAEVEEILEMLVVMGQAVGVGNGRYAAG